MQFGERMPIETLSQAETSNLMEERRSDRRRRVLKSANIYFNKGYGAFDCTIKNLASGGALVEMEDSSGLPGSFDFVIKGEPTKHQATISWRRNGMAGVKFL